MFGMFFLGALYLQRILGYSALEVGLAFLPSTVVMGTLSVGYADKVMARFGARGTLFGCLTLIAAALLLFARTPVHGSYLTDVLPPVLVSGIGAGLSFPALMTLAMSGATPEDAGLASGLVNTSAQVGGAIGLAVLATVATQRTGAATGLDALNAGYHAAYMAGAILIGAALAVTAFVLQGERHAARAARPAYEAA
jgi:MFS family permease